MPRKRGQVTEQDKNDWAHFVRQVVPLPGRVVPPAPAVQPVPPGEPRAVAPARTAPRRATPVQVDVGAAPSGLDGGTWTRFRTGRVRAERTLDLHGRTAQHAYHALHDFLHRAHADRVRCVEVITGRGAGETGGVLRRELPVWLNLPALRPMVLAATHPHPGNLGAVRVLLRRWR